MNEAEPAAAIGTMRPLMNGLYVPEHVDDTAPIDIVDQPLAPTPISTAPTTDARSRPAEARPPTPGTPLSTAPAAVEPPGPPEPTNVRGPALAELPVLEKEPRRPILRPALADWIRARAEAKRAKPVRTAKVAKARSREEEDETITTGAFATVCALTVAVSALCFVLSFDMMATAAERFGWSEALAKLFPVVIDLGAVGGTVMIGISTHRVYRHTGYQLVITTLLASVLFNLVGHDIRGEAVLGLPRHWAWTGTVAAVLVPFLLALFVHAAARALRAYMTQRRAAQAAAEEAQKAARERRHAEANRLRQGAQSQNPTAQRPVTAPNASATTSAASATLARTTAPAPAAVPATVAPQRKQPPTSAAPTSQEAAQLDRNRPVKKDVAIQLGRQHGVTTPSQLRSLLKREGYDLPNSRTTLTNWCREITEPAAE
ncbi:hypothetical protein DI005_20030 [Prauserella sp. PE36]|uniref:DUF2637 domain-containing protein n=1 Tax=Prauserella sp. PE36 TaxID=1504709 RepID=UPI000DE43C9B|nr:DUF2637 domain-containing protein [Prauserella sp. PE36]RBM18085.1 hypothetical protein DI005_20030 [Prauserella sp. PE36]